jgi:ABC-2 type transport system permease protein
VSFVGPVLLTLPVAVAAAVTAGSQPGRWLTLALGTAYGLGLLALGVILGGRRLDRRSPEVLGQLAHAQL